MTNIIPHGENPALRETAREIPVAEITSPRIQTLISDMRALLAKEEYGVALAASQVGEALRLFIVSGEAVKRRSEKYHDPADEAAVPDMVCINPVLQKLSRGRMNKHEGCLSIRGKWGVVPRAEKATLKAYDESGKEYTRGASGLLAHIFQHEMDHLEGILYTDKAAELYDDEKSEE